MSSAPCMLLVILSLLKVFTPDPQEMPELRLLRGFFLGVCGASDRMPVTRVRPVRLVTATMTPIPYPLSGLGPVEVVRETSGYTMTYILPVILQASII